jgi:protein ImuB
MSVWLALVFPALPLQRAERALHTPGPLAIVDGPPQRLRVVFCNAAASAAGIAPGSKLAAAQALARDLIVLPRQPHTERDTLAELAGWAYQFGAQVVVRPTGVLLETGASRRLFGGLPALHRRIRRSLAVLGYRAALAYAPVPRAAWWLAQGRAQGLAVADVTVAAALRAAVEPLPFAVCEWDAAAIDTLHALGLHSLGDLLRLPRAAVTRRLGEALLADLDRALGALPDPQPLFAPPESFGSSIELPADLTEASQLLFPAHRLLRLAEGFLRGRDVGATDFAFSTHHGLRHARPVAPTVFSLRLAAPERSAARLARLLTERLMRVRLPQPATALTLRIDRLLPFTASTAQLLPGAAAQTHTDWLQLAETLLARLGGGRVFRLQAVQAHLPEQAWRAVPLALQATDAVPTRATPQRPLLILPAPQPLLSAADDEPPHCNGPLTLIAGPERIESGWWQRAQAPCVDPRRDYFVARNPRGQTLWVYRELSAPRGWFLHGLFA